MAGSFAQRMASLGSIAPSVENWDDDGDLDAPADLFSHPVNAAHSLSSRISVRSESMTGDDDWQVLIAPNDESSTMDAITSAKHAGIPIPASVPSSALLGGAIKRLGKKKSSSRKVAVDDDWGNDLELPSDPNQSLTLKPPVPRTPADDPDFDDWGEGSLGIRFAGKSRGARSSSVSAMSPSLGSCITFESEDDDLNGLVLPTEPLDFSARLEKLKTNGLPTPDASPLPPLHRRDPPPTSAPALESPIDLHPPVAQPSTMPMFLENVPISVPPPTHAPAPIPTPTPAPKLPGAEDEDDFLDGLDIGGEEALDPRKLTLNRNVVLKKPPPKVAPPPAARPATTLTFTDKAEKPAMSKIPRPLSTGNRSRLTPVYESGATKLNNSRPMPTTTSAQLLRAKRSAPLLRNNQGFTPRASAPFLPTGSSNVHAKPHHVMAKPSSFTHLRRDSDPRRPLSPSSRPYSRMSTAAPFETPVRSGIKRELAPSALSRHPTKLTQPKGRSKNYGDGTELEVFDDLPTSATKEKQFEKAPRNVASNRTLRQQSSISRLPMPDRMATPMPQTPRSPPKPDSTPRFARDTAASRNAREQRLASKPRGEAPLVSGQINWKVHVAARSPHTSPTAHRKKGSGSKPQLIRGLFEPYAKTEKGMVYNPTLQRWEGNEEALAPFTHPNGSSATLDLTTVSTPTFAPPNNPFAHERSHSISHTALTQIQQKSVSSRAVKIMPRPVPSPPRPALISQKTMPRGVQYEGRMVFDPVKMTWLKAPRPSDGPLSPSADMDDEEDPFAGLEDLKDNESVAGHGPNGPGGHSVAGGDDPAFVGEEFDLGPSFIRRQREEEAIWRRKTEGWVGNMRDNGEHKHGGWRWAIRNLVTSASDTQWR